MLTQNFVSSNDDPNTAESASQVTTEIASNREPIKHMLIGSPKTVTSTIHALQVLGYAEVGAWSPLLPTTNPGEVMSLLIRYILVQ
ncbi:hypothetical protein WA1_24140 [Scytonema hofmannii PCC 7110]|uniref:Uncharacterized protein n=1 Tax=Scytonema hofmannii PCC 7110 TaxID=128403 RepID=A0A139X7X9_9CYAN|nr:hypothetical protein [Scytonema hofmannii]KYC40733.1 hypothetical protein WA1_24140 [Scytonema hofmannii PCC 7110]USN26948.1 hypothetical protein [synthetic construct]